VAQALATATNAPRVKFLLPWNGTIEAGLSTESACRTESSTVNNDDINVLALVKGRERYIFLYDDSQRAETLRILGRYASDPQLSFSWYDAAVLSQKIRHMGQEAKEQNRISLTQPLDFEE